jgi:hypothetical protein
MGFFDNWLTDKVSVALGRSAAAPQPAATASPAPAKSRQRVRDEENPHDFTTKPTIDPEVLKTILPRDGRSPMTVSGLDGVLTVGADMVMTTDQPIHCQVIRVLGTLEATVNAQKIIIAEGGRVVGSVRVNDAEISGEFDGSLQARGAVTIHPGARLTGKVRALELTISKQAFIEGADIKRVVPRVFEDLSPDAVNEPRYEEGSSSMCITVSRHSALRRAY